MESFENTYPHHHATSITPPPKCVLCYMICNCSMSWNYSQVTSLVDIIILHMLADPLTHSLIFNYSVFRLQGQGRITFTPLLLLSNTHRPTNQADTIYSKRSAAEIL